MIIEEAPTKIESEPKIIKVEPEPESEPEEVKFEIAKPGLVTEEVDDQKEQNNFDDFGIRAEALYDYQAGNRLI